MLRRVVVLLMLVWCSRFARADSVIAKLQAHLGHSPALVAVVTSGAEADVAIIGRLADQTPWILYCCRAASGSLKPLRDWASRRRLLGNRIYVAEDDGGEVGLADGMADAVWVATDLGNQWRQTDLMRSLRPGGVLLQSGKVQIKPADAGVDEWRHPYHAPDNNVVSSDRIARLPGELRFQTQPVFASMPNQTLFAGGRIFFFSGHIAFHEREEPLLNRLTVLNAYNGLRLWSRPLDPHVVVHNVAKFATATEVVFAEGKTLWMLDAATGDERSRHRVPDEAAAAGDTDWKWIAQQDDLLFAAFGPPDGTVAAHREKRRMGHWPWNVANQQYQTVTNQFGAARRLMAFHYPDMKPIWNITETVPFDARALCIDTNRLFQLSPGRFMAVRDAKTGKEHWRQTPKTQPDAFDAIGAEIKRQGWGLGWATYCCAHAQDGVVCIAGPPFKKTVGINLENGSLLWTSDDLSPHPFFVDNALYVMPRVSRGTAVCRKLDPMTGQALDEVSLGVIGSCTRLTGTPYQFFFRPGGGEGRTVYFEFGSKTLAPYQGIVRPGCFDGVVPANGRLYWMPLACDCWQVHGTISMAPRSPLTPLTVRDPLPWQSAKSDARAAAGDWPMFRADARGTATVPVTVPETARVVWKTTIPSDGVTAPTAVGRHVYVGSADGIVRALDAATGQVVWQVPTNAAVTFPPVYWNGRVVFGSCDGTVCCVDATDGALLGRIELAPEKRFINIMNRLTSAWPVGGGVVVNDNGIAYAAAGSTAADGSVVAAIDLAKGKLVWRQRYTLDRPEPTLSFGVQANLLLADNKLYIDGGPPVGIVTLNAATGEDAEVAAKLEAGMEMFLEPDNRPFCGGPELYSNEFARTTIFKRHQGRIYFDIADRHIALIDGRLFCADNQKPLDDLVALMNTDANNAPKMATPRDVMKVPIAPAIRWATNIADIQGLAIGHNGLVVLHKDQVEGLDADGRSLWTVPLTASPTRWGIALTASHCLVTQSNGQVICVARAAR